MKLRYSAAVPNIAGNTRNAKADVLCMITMFQIQRLIENLKSAKSQLAALADTILKVESQRDKYRMKILQAKEVLGKLPNAVDVGFGDLDNDGTLC